MMYGRSVIRNYSSIGELSLALTAFLLLTIYGSLAQDILFPGDIQPAIQRITTVNVEPVSTMKCPENMTLTKMENETESFCECIVGNLYYPKLDRCFLQYTRGPCKQREHFILRPNSTIAKCVRNPCTKKDTIPYKGSCYELYVSGGPCDSNNTLTVPETSFEPECVEIFAVNYQVITAPVKTCGPGTRRMNRGMCRTVL